MPVSPLAPGAYDQSTWEKRPDGTRKGKGYLGVLRRPDGGVSTEISVGVSIGGKDMDIPVLVPTLSDDEVQWLLKTPTDRVAKSIPQSILRKAVDHAKMRLRDGRSVFAD